MKRLYTPRHAKTVAALVAAGVIGGVFLFAGFVTGAVIAAIEGGR